MPITQQQLAETLAARGVEPDQVREVLADLRPRTPATDFLVAAIKDGPRPTAELRTEAEAAGIKEGVLQAARRSLGVGTWQVWGWPPAEAPKAKAGK